MHFSTYLSELPTSTQEALATDLTLGCGWVYLAAHRSRASRPLVMRLSRLALAYASLLPARAALGGAPQRPESGTVPSSQRATRAAGLRAASALAQDVSMAVAADTDMVIVHALITELLVTLTALRDEALDPR